MKITKSTSRISISGTTFISEIVPSFAPPREIPMTRLASRKIPREEDSHTLRRPGSGRCKPLEETLLPGLELGRNQADSVDTGAAHNVDGAGHFHEQNVVVALNERNFLGALLKDRFETRTKAIPSRVFVVDLQFVVGKHLNDDGLILQLLIFLLVWIGLRNQSVQTMRSERSDDHENDKQHKQDVDERNDVHFRQRTALTFSNIHSHCESPVSLRL